MTCEYCGAPMEDGTIYCTQCGALHSQAGVAIPVTPGAMPHPEPETKPEPTPEPPPVSPPPKTGKSTSPTTKVLLNICTVLLCLLLSVSILVTMLVIDLNRLVSREGLTAITRELLTMQEPLQPSQPTVYRLTETSDEKAKISEAEDLADLVYDALKEKFGKQFEPSREQLTEFAKASSVQDFVAGKLGSYADDLLNGTRNTTIETDEILELVDENAALVEDIFSVTVDREFRQELKTFLEKNDLTSLIRLKVLEPLANMEIPGLSLLGGSGAATVADLLEQIQLLSSGSAIAVMSLLDAIFCILLFLTNRCRAGQTLLSAGIPALVVGTLLSLPVLVFSLLPMLIGNALGIGNIISGVISALTGRIAPVHYGTAGVGLVLVIAGGVVCSAAKKQKKRIS